MQAKRRGEKMKVVVCIDDNGGMLFNRRRQSRDQALLEDVMKRTDKLWIHSFSEKLFAEYKEKMIIADDFLTKAGYGETCFVENQHLESYTEKIEEFILYKWNRKYPADFCLDINLNGWNLKEESEFAGTSHEKITREIYSKGC